MKRSCILSIDLIAATVSSPLLITTSVYATVSFPRPAASPCPVSVSVTTVRTPDVFSVVIPHAIALRRLYGGISGKKPHNRQTNPRVITHSPRDVLVDRTVRWIGGLHPTVNRLLFVKRNDHNRYALILREAANVFVHGGVGGHDGVGLDGDAAVGVLLEVLEGVDDVVGLRLCAVERLTVGISVVVDDEHGGGAAGELNEVADVDTDWGSLGGVRSFEEINDGWDISWGVNAHRDSEFAVGFCSLD
nr:hypothetical protein TorRG33x02_243520 [Ipomoea batatas]